MANSAEYPKQPLAGRWRFGLRGMFLITFIAALAAAEARGRPNQWSVVLFAIVSGVTAIGLVNQARDLRQAARLLPQLDQRQRWSVRFSVGWRVAVVLLFGGWYLVRMLVRAGMLSLPDATDNFFNVGEALRAAFLYLLLLIAAGHAPPRRRRLGGLSRRLVHMAGAIAAALLALAIWWQQAMMVYFVQVACIGIAESGPLKFVGKSSVLRDGHPPFLRASAAGIVICAMVLIVARRLVTRQHSTTVRWLLAVLAVMGLANGLAIDFWLAGPGLHGASPWMAETFVVQPVNLWLTALIVIATLVTLTAVRWRAFDAGGEGRPLQVWLRDGRPYVHEGIAWALLLAIAAGWRACEIFHTNPFVYSSWGLARTIAEQVTMDNETALVTVLCFVALRRVWQRLWHRPLTAPIEIVEFDPWRFLLGWLLLFLLALVALPIVAAFSVALYFTRWYTLPMLDWY